MAAFSSCSLDEYFSFRQSNNSARVCWKIKDFSTLKEKYYSSPEFAFKGVNWVLSFNPFEDEDENELNVGLYLTPLSSFSSKLKFHFFVENESGQDVEFEEIIHDFLDGKAWGFNIVNRQDLLDGKLGDFLPNDVLTVYCKMKTVEYLATETETSTDTEKNPTKSGLNLGMDLFLSKLRQMLDSGKFSDVVLRVGEETLPAHKMILSANSDLFQAMFDSDLKENRDNVVDLVDMDSTVAKAMLLYMYTKEIEELDLEKTFALYIAAGRYMLIELKDKCREYVTDNLSFENVVEVFDTAKLHSDDVLLEAAKHFFANNVRSILKSKKWKEYSARNLSSSLELVSYAITSNDLFFLK